MGNYISVEEMRAFKIDGNIVDLTSYDSIEIETDIGLAESIIEGITGDVFNQRSETNLFDGNGLVRLFFYPIIPYRLLSVTSVKEFDIDSVTVIETFVENDNFKTFDHYLETTFKFADHRARIRSGFSGGIAWPLGQRNIAIEGIWGRNIVPPEIKRAVLLLALERLVPGSTNMTGVDVTQAVWPDFTLTFRIGQIHGQTTGFGEVDRLLEGQINYVSMFLTTPDFHTLHESDRGT